MNILHKAALKGLIKNRTRTLVTVIGVAMSAAMITAVAAFGVSLLHYLAEGAAEKYGGWHIACLDADASYAREWANDENAADTVFFENIGYAVPGGGKNPKRPYLFIAGFNRKTFDTLPITLISGRLPENSGEILLSGKMGADGGFPCSVGDTLTLEVGKRMSGNDELGQKDPYRPGDEFLAPQGEKTYRVVGICGTPVFEDPSYPGYTAITRTDARDTSGAAVPDTADSLTLFVTLKHPRQVHSYARQMADGHDCILNHDLLRIMGLSDSPSDRLFNAFLFAFAGVVIAIIMIGSVFLIHNSFSISLNERTQQIGIFASVGATSKQLRDSVLFEGNVIKLRKHVP